MNYLLSYTPKQKIKEHIRYQFKYLVGYEPDLENPKTLNEKLQWLKLHYRDPMLTKCSDKYSVRKYVSETIGDEFLVNLLGVYKNVEDINFEILPLKFVLKTNNGSGTNIICDDKSKLNIEEAKKKLYSWMLPESNHYYFSYEWCYKNIKPKIICEEYIEEIGKKDLSDYKVLCLNGKPKLMFVTSDRKKDLKIDFFDLEWNKLPFSRKDYGNSKKKIEKPKNFKLMIKIAEELSKPFPCARVDLYEVEGKVIFGELTFYPAGGMIPFSEMEFYYKLGSMLELPRPQSFLARSKNILIPSYW